MDEQQPEPTDPYARPAAPTPPPPRTSSTATNGTESTWAESSGAESSGAESTWAESGPSGSEGRGRRRHPWRLAAAAMALVLASGGVGVVVGRAVGGFGGRTSASSGAPFSSPFGSLPRGGFNGGEGFTPFGNGSGGNGSDQQSAQTQGTTKATAAQMRGLVRIQTTLGYENGAAAGTGMILTSSGEVLTNHHVVEGSTAIKVTVMSTGKTYQARVVGTDASQDVAVLQLVGASGLTTITPDTTLPTKATKVVVVGDAEGRSDHLTAAAGTVTAHNQTITTASTGGDQSETLHGLLQVAAAVISGDSGGAVYDAQQEVVAMTTAAASGRAMGFAIPISTVLTIAQNLENHVTSSAYAYGRPAFLGIALSARRSAPVVAGVYDGTPAARAGLVAGDRITRIGNTRVSSATQLQHAVRQYSPGDRVQIAWTDQRGTTHTATVTLASGPIA